MSSCEERLGPLQYVVGGKAAVPLMSSPLGLRLDFPTGCATSFTSTAIRFESILHRFSLSRKRRCLNPCPWTSASVERACQGASIENTAALCILWARLIQADESLARTAGQVEAFCHLLRQRQGYRLRGGWKKWSRMASLNCRHVHALCTKRSLPDKQGSLWRGATGQRQAFSSASNC